MSYKLILGNQEVNFKNESSFLTVMCDYTSHINVMNPNDSFFRYIANQSDAYRSCYLIGGINILPSPIQVGSPVFVDGNGNFTTTYSDNTFVGNVVDISTMANPVTEFSTSQPHGTYSYASYGGSELYGQNLRETIRSMMDEIIRENEELKEYKKTEQTEENNEEDNSQNKRNNRFDLMDFEE